MNSYISFPISESMSLTRQIHESMSNFALSLGMQDYEIGEYENLISEAFDTLDARTLRKNPNLIERVMKKIISLSNTHNYVYVPFEKLIDSFSNSPDFFVDTLSNSELSNQEMLDALGIIY